MSTKSSLFLTEDNEHWYEETSEQHRDAAGQFAGYTIIMEFDKKNIEIDTNDDNDLIISIKPGSELYNRIKAMRS